MSTPLGLIAQGSFTSDGSAKIIELPKKPNYFVTKNVTRWGSGSNAVIETFWFDSMADGQAKLIKESAANALSSDRTLTGTNGFRFYDSTVQTPGAPVALTAITAASPAVVSTATTPSNGDIVRIYSTTGMLQVAGMDFTVGNVVASTSFELTNLDASGFAAAATAGYYRVIPAAYYQPALRYITKITQAANAVITFSVNHNYQVGDKIRIKVPTAFGMTEMNGKLATVLSITAGTVTVDINSAAFTAFAFPASAVAGVGVSFPHAVPVGEIATSLVSPIRNEGYYAMEIGTVSVGSSGQTIEWMAFAADYEG